MSIEQFELDLGLDDTPRQSARTKQADTDVRRSFQTMVRLALERGNAKSAGDLLDQIATLRQHAPFNAMLAILQRPHATWLLSPDEWETGWGRRITPGEHPIVLLVPWGPVTFRFDVSQTEATEGSRALPPEMRNPFEMKDVIHADVALTRMTASAKRDGVRVAPSREGLRRAGCITPVRQAGSQRVPGRQTGTWSEVPIRWEVLLNSAHSPTERLATLAHELGHLYCGHVGRASTKGPDRRHVDEDTGEFEAESVAHLVFRRIAPEAVMPPYLEHRFGPGQPLPNQGWNHVMKAAERVLELTHERETNGGKTARASASNRPQADHAP